MNSENEFGPRNEDGDDVLEAREIILRDCNGKKRILLSASEPRETESGQQEPQPRIEIYDRNGATRVVVHLYDDDDTPEVSLFNRDYSAEVRLSVHPSPGQEGSSAIVMVASDGESAFKRVELAADSSSRIEYDEG